MAVLKKHLEDFTRIRRQFLVEPEAAAHEFCAELKEEKVCSLGVEIRAAGLWEDLCKHQEARTFYAERFYMLTLQCRTALLKVFSRDLPALRSLIKR